MGRSLPPQSRRRNRVNAGRRSLFVAAGSAAWALSMVGTARAAGAPNDPAAGSFHEAKEAGRWSLLIAAVALLFVLPFALWIIELVVKVFSGHYKKVTSPVVLGWIRGAVIGADKRLSTSKTIAVVWTYMLASALLAIVIAKWWGHPAAYKAQVATGLQAGYALLIGGPLGAAILAKGIVTSQVASGQSKPATKDGAKAADLVNNDEGGTDLGDLQYVLFNTVALTFFLGELLTSPQLGLPTIPDVLLGLTSVSAVGYVAKKALPAPERKITKVEPPAVPLAQWRTGTALKLLGSGLLNADQTPPDQVRFENAAGGQNASRVLAGTTTEGLVLDVEIPPNQLTAGKYDALVVTSEGNKVIKTDALELTN
jgi:hypothetical protein